MAYKFEIFHFIVLDVLSVGQGALSELESPSWRSLFDKNNMWIHLVQKPGERMDQDLQL
jgi:hypothetical protein